MDGVQFILHNPQYTVDYTWGWSWEGLIYLALIGIIFFLLFLLRFIYKENRYRDFFAMLPIIIVSLFLAFSEFLNAKEIKTYLHSEYVVVVHEGVDCKEFLEKYEVVEQNGDLITIKEREIENDNT